MIWSRRPQARLWIAGGNPHLIMGFESPGCSRSSRTLSPPSSPRPKRMNAANAEATTWTDNPQDAGSNPAGPNMRARSSAVERAVASQPRRRDEITGECRSDYMVRAPARAGGRRFDPAPGQPGSSVKASDLSSSPVEPVNAGGTTLGARRFEPSPWAQAWENVPPSLVAGPDLQEAANAVGTTWTSVSPVRIRPGLCP